MNNSWDIVFCRILHGVIVGFVAIAVYYSFGIGASLGFCGICIGVIAERIGEIRDYIKNNENITIREDNKL